MASTFTNYLKTSINSTSHTNFVIFYHSVAVNIMHNTNSYPLTTTNLSNNILNFNSHSTNIIIIHFPPIFNHLSPVDSDISL